MFFKRSRLSPYNITDNLTRSDLYREIRNGNPSWPTYEIRLDEVLRPELISKRHYGTDEMKWAVLVAAELDDMREPMEAGKKIKLPPVTWTRERIRYWRAQELNIDVADLADAEDDSPSLISRIGSSISAGITSLKSMFTSTDSQANMSNIEELDHLLETDDAGIVVHKDGDALNDCIMEWLETPEGTVADLPGWGNKLAYLKHEPPGINLVRMAKIGILRKIQIDIPDLTVLEIAVVFKEIDLLWVAINYRYDDSGQNTYQTAIFNSDVSL